MLWQRKFATPRHGHGVTMVEIDHEQVSHRHNLYGYVHCTTHQCYGECSGYLSALDREVPNHCQLDHFIHAHMMREGPGNSVFICYSEYDKEFELPCPKLSLYSIKRLTLHMEKKEPARHSIAGPMTRGRTRHDA